MRTRLRPRHLLAAAALAVAACQQLQPAPQKPQAVTPQITEDVLRQRAKDSLAEGVKQYDAGDYEGAEKSLSAALDHGLLAKTEQSRARKLLAFIYCTSNRETQCRDEFRKAFEIDPHFALTSAEDGHPIWGPVYRDVRTQLIAEREAAETEGKPAAALGRGEQMLADGIVKYDAGEFDAARKVLEGAIAEGLKKKTDQAKAMKYIAFTECLERRYRACRAEFIKIYDVDPNFDLAPAEAGHPSWTHTFAAAKATAKRALAQKAAREARQARERAAREKAAAPPTASVPKQ